MAKKNFNTMYGIGKAKYVVNFHNGKSKHNDGSPFYDIAIFKNKVDLKNFREDLLKRGYIETN